MRVALHSNFPIRGGAVLWEPEAGAFTSRCPEGGKVEVMVQRLDNLEPALYKKKDPLGDITDCVCDVLHTGRIMVEVTDSTSSYAAQHCGRMPGYF